MQSVKMCVIVLFGCHSTSQEMYKYFVYFKELYTFNSYPANIFDHENYVCFLRPLHISKCTLNFVCLFDSLRPINNLSVIKGRVFLG